ncbi:MAG TPA: hypothetical protein VHS99_24895, partial [Chloroflexota bacterium]|nr:hypothetical protein [Chloroflexota bacterium]
MNTLTIILLLGLLLWWYKPLRDFLVQRTNRTVKVLLVVFPLLFIGRLAHRIYTGQQDQWDVVTLTVGLLLLLWVALVWLTSWLERRRPTKVRAPDLATLSKIPGVPRIPGAAQQVAASPEVRRAAGAAYQAASRADWNEVAADVGRTS